jgi:NAD(P)-dependent dehydrogenase (short-subunit alcohol dehydrogenase family)
MDLGLEGRSVLITGASRGIGAAVASAFAAEGCRLHLAARSAEKLAEVSAALRAKHNDLCVELHPGDLADVRETYKLAAACKEVDILVNNAGAVPTGPIETVTDADWRSGFDLKIFATVNLTKELYAAMCARHAGVIINVIGNCGERPDPEIIIGTIANAGLMGFTRALGSVSPQHNVRVVGVNPGPTATERLVSLMQRKAADRTGDPDRWRDLVKPLPFGRAAEPSEVADMVVFSASDRASFVSGSVLTVDGGVAWRGHLF